MDSSLSVPCAHSLEEAIPESYSLPWGSESASKGLWGTNIVVSRGQGTPWFPREDVIGLFQ